MQIVHCVYHFMKTTCKPLHVYALFCARSRSRSRSRHLGLGLGLGLELQKSRSRRDGLGLERAGLGLGLGLECLGLGLGLGLGHKGLDYNAVMDVQPESKVLARKIMKGLKRLQ